MAAPTLPDQHTREDPRRAGNEAFKRKDFGEAVRLYTEALDSGDDAAACLTNRSNAYHALGDFEASRADARAALARSPRRAKALFRLAVAERKLGRPVAAVAAVAAAAAAAATDAEYAFFARKAVELGAWRVPPPRDVAFKARETRVRVVDAATREDFLGHAARGEPFVAKNAAATAGWSWGALRVDGVSGDVLATASGVVPDYARPGEAHASAVDGMAEFSLSLADVAARVAGERREPLLCAYEKVYVYGKRWPLEAPALAGLARASRPPFLEDGDVRGGGGVAWIGAAGTLTPLHYDLADGVLAQVLGSKRVWLFPPEAADACYLRSPRRPGVDNWERQSRASLHGAAAAAAWPDLGDRRVADLGPGDALFLPSNWLHEVHARSPSVSLGWRVAATDGDVTHERNAGQKLERLAASVKSGRVSVEESLAEAMRDPQMMELFMQQMPSIVR